MKNQQLFLTIFNVSVLVCFTVLAVHFDKWWIVIFAYLLFMFEKTKD